MYYQRSASSQKLHFNAQLLCAISIDSYVGTDFVGLAIYMHSYVANLRCFTCYQAHGSMSQASFALWLKQAILLLCSSAASALLLLTIMDSHDSIPTKHV